MKIPKRVNVAWDWAERNIRVLTITIAAVIAAGSVMWIPTLAAFTVGLVVGGLLVNQRMARRIVRQRAETDELLRENGRLRHRNTMLASGVITAESRATQMLVTIPEEAPQETTQADSDAERAASTQTLSVVPPDSVMAGANGSVNGRGLTLGEDTRAQRDGRADETLVLRIPPGGPEKG